MNLFPTIHLGGTNEVQLSDDYGKAYEAIVAAREAFDKIEFNSRDYLPYGNNGPWPQALAWREQITQSFCDIEEYNRMKKTTTTENTKKSKTLTEKEFNTMLRNSLELGSIAGLVEEFRNPDDTIMIGVMRLLQLYREEQARNMEWTILRQLHLGTLK